MTLRLPCDAAAIRSGPEGVRCARAVQRTVLVATILGSSMAFIDGTVVNVALPSLQLRMGATATDVQWVVEAYSLFLAALLLVGGSLGDRFGRRRTYGIGIAIFAAASVACGAAPTLSVLIAARAVQGVGAALLVPGSLAIISAAFPGPERGRAIGTWSGFSAMTAAIGPVLGGWLIEHLSWRWAFFVNLPIALVVLALLAWRVPESRDEQASGRLDLPGAVLVTLGLGGVVFALIESARLGWRHPAIVASFGAGAAARAGFVAVAARARAPMAPLALFRSRAFAGANALTLLLYGALGGVLFFLPLDLIQVHGYGATAAGAAFLPFIASMFALSRWSGGLVARWGSRPPLILGPLVTAIGFALLARPGTGGDYATTFLPAIAVMGLGMTVTVAPLTTTVMDSVEVHRAGVASGINNAVSRVAGLLAIAVLSAFVLRVFDAALDRRLAPLHLAPDLLRAIDAQRIRLGALEPPATASAAQQAAIRHAVAEAFVAGFRAVAWTAAALAAGSSAIAAWTMRGSRRPGQPTSGL